MDIDKAEQLLKDMHELSRAYIKLDLIYIGALAAVLAYFKLDSYGVIKNYDHIRQVAYLIFLLMVFDFVFIWLSLKDRFDVLDSKFKLAFRMKFAAIKQSLQMLIHFLAFTLVVAYSFGYFEGGKFQMNEFEIAGKIQNRIELFIKENGVSPNSLDDIKDEKFQSDLKNLYSKYDYKKTGNKEYEMKVYPIDDEKTAITISDYFNLNDYIDSLYKRKVE